MGIRLAKSDEEIAACYPVMRELRPHIDESVFVSRVRLQEPSGFRLAVVLEGGEPEPEPVAVAGHRIGENLAWGRFLYVDDLVTRSRQRACGYGAALLSWLMTQAVEAGCQPHAAQIALCAAADLRSHVARFLGAHPNCWI